MSTYKPSKSRANIVTKLTKTRPKMRMRPVNVKMLDEIVQNCAAKLREIVAQFRTLHGADACAKHVLQL